MLQLAMVMLVLLLLRLSGNHTPILDVKVISPLDGRNHNLAAPDVFRITPNGFFNEENDW